MTVELCHVTVKSCHVTVVLHSTQHTVSPVLSENLTYRESFGNKVHLTVEL